MKKFEFRYITLVAFFLLLSIPNPQKTQAKGPPGNWPGQEENSIQAGILFYNSLSNLYISLGALEKGPVKNANQIWEKTAKSFVQVTSIYGMIEKGVVDRQITFQGLDFDQIVTIALDFKNFNVKIPNTMRNLALINKQEIQSFEKLLNTITFTNNAVENRRLIRQFNEGIYRVMAMGTSISEIVAAQRKK